MSGPVYRLERSQRVPCRREEVFAFFADPANLEAVTLPLRGQDTREFDVEVFYDGQCPLCAREIRMLRRLDKRERIRFTDIATAGFDAGTAGLGRDALMERIHARLPDGSIVEGVEVFRRLYAAVGFARLVALTRLPWVARLLELGYGWFAANRLRLTGRCRDGACATRSAANRA